MEECQTLHVVALLGPGQQNLWERATVLMDTSTFKLRGGPSASAAVSIGRSDMALGSFYRRLPARIGKKKAVTATARKIVILFYNAIRHGVTYQRPLRIFVRLRDFIDLVIGFVPLTFQRTQSV